MRLQIVVDRSLATFGIGFVTRPIGAIVLGTLGDRIGRKPAMLISFVMMGVGMLGLALTPSYARIARHRLAVYAEKTTQVIHSQNAKLKYTGTPRARHSRPTHGSSGSAYETYAGATPASRIGDSATPASKPA
jgi:MFS family permease